MAKPLLKRITLSGFLSFAPTPSTLALEPLNVLIGPNASGKSNFVEALSVLRAVPRDLPLPIRAGGGVKDWLWRGAEGAREACLEIVLTEGVVASNGAAEPAIRYRVAFGASGESFVVLDERVENETAPPGRVEALLLLRLRERSPDAQRQGGPARAQARRHRPHAVHPLAAPRP